MILTIDTSILIDIDKGNEETKEKIKELVKIHKSYPVFLFIPYFEFYHGMKKRKVKNFQQMYELLQTFTYFAPTKQTGEILSELKEKYESLGKSMALADLLIASQVKEHNLLLVTKDKDFLEVKEIECILI